MLFAALALCFAAQDVFTQQAYVKSSNSEAGDRVGLAVALDGDTLVVGAHAEDSGSVGVNGVQGNNSAVDSGAVFVFVRHGLTWEPQAYLKASNTGANDAFGISVALDGDVLVVGASSEASAATGVNGNGADNSAPSAGAAYVFVRTGTTWTQQAYLKASNAQFLDSFGTSVDVSGGTIVVGAPLESSAATGVNGNQSDNSASFAGAAYVFVEVGGVWSQQAYLKASNSETLDDFARTVVISGNTIVVGAPFEDSSASGVNGNQFADTLDDCGAAYVFTRTAGVWSQQAYLKPSNTSNNDIFGYSVDVDGNTLAVGSFNEGSASAGVNGVQSDNSLSGAGAVYVFVRNAGAWSQQAYVKSSAPDLNDRFGASVALSGNRLIVGALFEDSAAVGIDGSDTDDSATDSGAAYLFTRSGTVWSQSDYIKASNTGAQDAFSCSVALSERTVVCGAYQEDSASTGVDGNEASDASGNSGAAYVFTDLHWGTVRGCLVNPAEMFHPSSDATIGSTVAFQVHAAALTTGVVATYWGVKDVDVNGCGLLLSPTEELLLALSPAPTLLGVTPLLGGIAGFSFGVPNNPALVGIEVTLQSAIVNTTTFASELSNAIEFEIRP